MAVVEVAGHKKDRQGTFKQKGVREYTLSFYVRTDDKRDGPLIVMSHPSIPRVGYTYVSGNDSDPTAKAVNITARLIDDSGMYWQVDVQFTNDFSSDDDNPLLRPPIYSGSFAQFQQAIERDLDGKLVTNSAGQYFDPPVEVDDSRPVIQVQRNLASFNFALAIQYQDAVNQGTFLGFGPGTVKVAGISFQEEIYQGTKYYAVTYEFHLRREGWKKKILDQGKMCKKGGASKGAEAALDPCLDADGRPVSEPALLNGEGKQLPSGDTPKFLEFKVYKELDFGAFGL